MEPDELTLSDVHIGQFSIALNQTTCGGYENLLSRFSFRTHQLKDHVGESQQSAAGSDKVAAGKDADGDLVVSRRNDLNFNEVIMIEHVACTRLVDVGFQVWQGCLLLCDFLQHNEQLLSDACVLELGAGVGLASIVAAQWARTVYTTDVGADVLLMCARNAERNKHIYKHQENHHKAQNVVRVRSLDWKNNRLFNVSTEDENSDASDVFLWNASDDNLLQTVKVLLAADVIYRDDLTDSFLDTVCRVLQSVRGCVLYVSIERRLNFTLEDLDISCPAYTHFIRRISDLSESIHAEQIDVNTVPQYFQYDRCKYLELWKFTCVTKP